MSKSFDDAFYRCECGWIYRPEEDKSDLRGSGHFDETLNKAISAIRLHQKDDHDDISPAVVTFVIVRDGVEEVVR